MIDSGAADFHRTQWKRGALIGGSIGFAAGLAVFSSVGEGSTGDHVRDGVVGAIGTGLLFAMVGGLIGSFFRS